MKKHNTKRSVIGLFIAAIIALWGITSCEDFSLDDAISQNLSSDTTELAQNNIILGDIIYGEAFESVNNILLDLEANNYQNTALKSVAQNDSVCPQVTVNPADSSTFPKTITIDYGEGCNQVVDNDTITKSGKIIITLKQGGYFGKGGQRTIELKDFQINGVNIKGTRTVTFDGINWQEKSISWIITLDNGSIGLDSNLQITREAEKIKTLYFGDSRYSRADDTLELTGSVSGLAANEIVYEYEITQPLKKSITCKFYSEGLIEATVADSINFSLDYGSGACDNIVTATHDGESRDISVNFDKQIIKKLMK